MALNPYADDLLPVAHASRIELPEDVSNESLGHCLIWAELVLWDTFVYSPDLHTVPLLHEPKKEIDKVLVQMEADWCEAGRGEGDDGVGFIVNVLIFATGRGFGGRRRLGF